MYSIIIAVVMESKNELLTVRIDETIEQRQYSE